MVDHGDRAPAGAPDQPNVEFARLLLDLAMTKAQQRRASEEAARAAFVEGGTHVVPMTDVDEPEFAVPSYAPEAPVVADVRHAAFTPVTPPAPKPPVDRGPARAAGTGLRRSRRR